MRRRNHTPRMAAGLLSALLAPGCMGIIGDPGAAAPGPPRADAGAGEPTPDECAERTLVADSSRAPRLTHAQWEHTVVSLLRLTGPTGQAPMLVSDGTYGGDLFVDERLWATYQAAAEAVASRVARDAAAVARLMPAGAPAAGAARTRAFVADFVRRAYRRPLTDAEVTRHVALFDSVAAGAPDPFVAGVEHTIRAVLQSPLFLYRMELGAPVPAGAAPAPLGGYEVASRLAYALWNTMPDDELFAAAARGELTTEAGVRAQAARLLRDPRAEGLVRAFHWSYLHLDPVRSLNVDATRIPTYRASMGESMAGEFDAFIHDLAFVERGGFTELMTADYTYANEDIAAIYGLRGVTGSAFRRVALPPERRGVLTQAGFLAAHGRAYHPDSIHRGVRMVNDVLCIPMGDPPDGIPPLPGELRNTTNRQRVEAHTNGSACVTCHREHINPLGFAFENFDGLGQYRRTEDNGLAIDASGRHPVDGVAVAYNGAAELMQAVAQSEQGHQCYTRRWVQTLAGRPAAPEDRCMVRRLGAESRRGLSIVELVGAIVASPEFRARR